MSTAFYYGLILISVLVASFSQILLKKSALKKHASFIREYLNPLVIIGYGMLFVSMIMTTFAYGGVEFKIVPVMESIGYIVVMILSLLFFREKITRQKAIGTLLILAGVIIFNM
ncbi:MAG: multidrug ABC transporter [Lachnospiraceae bacterium]|nr:multidrug ABC transporter [Lachnospiraceae bacterium]